jgi:hypothetical protein
MTQPNTYKALYKDKSGSTEILIKNDFKTLSLEIDGVKFEGPEFSDLSIIDRSNYSEKQLGRFSFFSTTELCDCVIEVIIPQIIIDQRANSEFKTDITITFSLGKKRTTPQGGIEFEETKASITIEGKTYEGIGNFLEIALDKLYQQFGDRYKLKNCYGCLYGDYSAYGQSTFGTMLCYVKQKEEYLKVKTKDDYLKKLTGDFQKVQEIFCCKKYKVRKKGTGYRG